jgi:SNF2 family DNA or RNA helicase
LKIDVIHTTIIVYNSDSLKDFQTMHLDFLNYTETNDIFFKKTNVENIEPELIKIKTYFDEESVNLEFNNEAKAIIDEFLKRTSSKNSIVLNGKNIKNGILNIDSFSHFNTFIKTLPRKLKPHQIKSAFHLYSLKNGANFSVPGSGKTTVVLSVFEKLRVEDKCNVLFVIGPPSCFQPWQNEFNEVLGRNPETIKLSGGNKNWRKSEYYKSFEDINELYLCTYHTALNDYDDINNFFRQKKINVFLVVDEAHYFKQVGGSWSTCLLKIAEKAAFRCALTGTPIPKSYKDIFNLFDFLWLNDSPLSEKDKIQIDNWEKQKNNLAVKELLNEKIGPLFYRVRKKDLGLKPAIFHEPIIMKMNTYEQVVHDYIKAKIHQLTEDEYFNNEDILSKLWRGRMIRVRQASSYPKLLLKAIEGYDENLLKDSDLMKIIRNYDDLEKPSKLLKLSQMVEELNRQGQKVLIWSNFIGTLEVIKKHFTTINLRSELIYGKTPVRKENLQLNGDEKTREDIRDEFVDINSGLDILIANPAACAESISLHKTCFHAIYYDLSYNCAQYLQSLDRIHRVGGSELNTANYYFLQYENSVDQDIKRNLETKANKMYEIIEEDYEIYNLDLYEEEQDDDIAAYKRLFKPNQNQS